MAIDWEATDREAIRYLRQELCPVHYRELFRKCHVGAPDNLGDKTDAGEKLRQRYGEHEHEDIVLVPGGYLALRYWFPYDRQPKLFHPDPMLIDGNCLVSYWAGYEHAKREQYLFDHYRDGATDTRKERRRLGFLFESHVRNYYLGNWSAFCTPPTNAGIYDKPADNDFMIRLPDGITRKLDCKTASYSEEGQNKYKVRKLDTDTIYIAGKWDDEREEAIVTGIVSGWWLRRMAGHLDGDFISDGELMSFEILPVMLNMANNGQEYHSSFRDIVRRDRRVPVLSMAVAAGGN